MFTKTCGRQTEPTTNTDPVIGCLVELSILLQPAACSHRITPSDCQITSFCASINSIMIPSKIISFRQCNVIFVFYIEVSKVCCAFLRKQLGVFLTSVCIYAFIIIFIQRSISLSVTSYGFNWAHTVLYLLSKQSLFVSSVRT